MDAAIKCIEAFDGGVNVILGGKDKGGDYSPLAPVARARCSNVILIGAAADKIAAALLTHARCSAPRRWRKRSKSDWGRKTRRDSAARPGLRQLRHVRQLRTSRQSVQGGGEETGNGA